MGLTDTGKDAVTNSRGRQVNNRLSPADVFYFEAHTGMVWDTEPKAPSNVYRYLLPLTIKREVVEMVAKTPLDADFYKAFPADWLQHIAEIDRMARKRMVY